MAPIDSSKTDNMETLNQQIDAGIEAGEEAVADYRRAVVAPKTEPRTCGGCQNFDDCEDVWEEWLHTRFDPERPAPDDCFEPRTPNTEEES